MSSFQIKPVGDFCNIQCAYCRNRGSNRATRTIMSTDTLEQLFEFFASVPQEKIRLNWHGGEPLLAGKEFFRKITDLESSRPNKIWANTVQTNAILIDEEWASFFKQHQFHVGVSVDGNKDIHDANRIDAVGHGTHDRAIAGVEILRKHGIHPGVISVVTKETASCGAEMLKGLADSGFTNIAFNAFYNTASVATIDNRAVTDKEWLAFLVDVFESWQLLDRPDVSVREIDATLAWLKGKLQRQCSFVGSCARWFTVDYTGNIYPCGRLGRSTQLGNVKKHNFEEIVNNPTFLQWVITTQRLPQKCVNCKFVALCHNGCVSHRSQSENDVLLFAYCESRIGFYNYLRLNLSHREEGKQ